MNKIIQKTVLYVFLGKSNTSGFYFPVYRVSVYSPNKGKY